MRDYSGVEIEESVLLPAGWVFATQSDGIDTYLGPLKDMPANPKFSKLKLPRDLYAALTQPPRLKIPSAPVDCRIIPKYERYRL